MIKLIVNVLGNPDEKDMHFCSDKVAVQLGSVRLCLAGCSDSARLFARLGSDGGTLVPRRGSAVGSGWRWASVAAPHVWRDL